MVGSIVPVIFDDAAVDILEMFTGGAGLGFERLLFVNQGFPVIDRDLIVVGMDFAEGQEAVPVAAEIDECRLQRRLYPRYFREIDVAFDLFFECCLDVVFVETGTGCNNDANFFSMCAVNKHALRHITSPVWLHFRRANDRSKMCRTIKTGRTIVNLPNRAVPEEHRQGRDLHGSRNPAISRVRAWVPYTADEQRNRPPFRADIRVSYICAEFRKVARYSEYNSISPADVRKARIDLGMRRYNLYS